MSIQKTYLSLNPSQHKSLFKCLPKESDAKIWVTHLRIRLTSETIRNYHHTVNPMIMCYQKTSSLTPPVATVKNQLGNTKKGRWRGLAAESTYLSCKGPDFDSCIHAGQLSVASNCSPKESSALFWPPRASADDDAHIHRYKQMIIKQTEKQTKKLVTDHFQMGHCKLQRTKADRAMFG